MRKNLQILVLQAVFLAFSINTYSQITPSSLWTWMKGANVADAPAVYGTRGVPAPLNTPGSRWISTKWTDSSGNLWLFGGYKWGFPFDFYFNDLWKYDPQINQWTWISGDTIPNKRGIYGIQGIASTTNKPGARRYAVSWVDNSGYFWLYGGAGYSSGGLTLLNDLWKFDPYSNQWTWIKGDTTTVAHYGSYGVKGSFGNSNPGGREMAYSSIDKNNNLYIFGGRGLASYSYGELNDLWKYDPNTNKWAWIKGDTIPQQLGVYGTFRIPADSCKPGARARGVSWTDQFGNFWLFSGDKIYDPGSTSENALPNDLWKYDIITNQWVWMNGDSSFYSYGNYGIQGVPDNLNQPPSKAAASSCTDEDGNLWIFGGAIINGGAADALNDLWKYNTTTNQWTWMYGNHNWNQNNVYGTQGVASASNIMGVRGDHALWSDKLGNLWVFGGGDANSASGLLNDLWKLTAILNIIHSNASCNNSNGTITIIANYGISPYLYSIDGINFQTSNTFTGLPATTYTITVKDAVNIFATTTITIANESAPFLSAISTASTCSNNNGSITANASGGKAPLQYSINGITYQSANTFTNLSAGSYILSVKDANNCIATKNVSIADESSPALTAIPTNATCVNNDGTITATATGGKSPLQYSINGTTYQISNVFTGLAAGDYTVSVKDANTCVATYPVTVSSSTFPPSSAIGLYPNPASNNQFTIVLGNQLQGSYSIRVLDMTGQLVYKTTISNTCTCCSGSYLIKLPFIISSGIYNIEVVSPNSERHVQKLMVTSLK